MINKPLTEKDIEMMDYFHISIVQSAKRLLKQELNEKMESVEELFIALNLVDACFQIDDGKE